MVLQGWGSRAGRTINANKRSTTRATALYGSLGFNGSPGSLPWASGPPNGFYAAAVRRHCPALLVFLIWPAFVFDAAGSDAVRCDVPRCEASTVKWNRGGRGGTQRNCFESNGEQWRCPPRPLRPLRFQSALVAMLARQPVAAPHTLAAEQPNKFEPSLRLLVRADRDFLARARRILPGRASVPAHRNPTATRSDPGNQAFSG
jgi:hypothetical protein